MSHRLSRFAPPARTPSPRRSRWRLEHLEDRSVPAGDVLAVQAGNTLTLTGDDLGNGVRLLPGALPNEVVVQGDGTTVNGSAAPQLFTGVHNLSADLRAGDDSLVADGLTLAAIQNRLVIDGNAGDDHIELTGTTIQSLALLDVQIYGERVAGGSASGTTGNDTIRLLGTTLTARTSAAVTINGETNAGGEVTGGNDEITIADSVIAARGGFNHGVRLEIVGDANTAVGGQTATVGGGNDRISIRHSTIEAAGTAAGSRNRVIVRLFGDVNTVNATIPGTTTGADTFGTIGGGNDDIAVTDTHIAARAPGTGTSDISVLIVGDRNLVSGSADPVVIAAATVGGGNDSIAVAGSTVAATGAPSNTVRVDVLGEDIEAFALPFTTTTTSTVGGGNDRIAVTDTPVVTDGVFGDTALLFVRGEAATGSYATIVVGGGNDTVTVQNVRFAVGAIDDLTGFFIDTGSGNDRVQVTDSAAQFYSISLGDGDDRLTFTNNFIGANFFGAPASLDGGPGFDRLTAHGNTGPGGLTWFNFEAEDVTT